MKPAWPEAVVTSIPTINQHCHPAAALPVPHHLHHQSPPLLVANNTDVHNIGLEHAYTALEYILAAILFNLT
jgi:hypothetical protein